MTDAKNDPAETKRPYATLDLKATEIKVTPIGEKMQPTAGTTKAPPTPAPAPASAYASFQGSAFPPAGTSKKDAGSTKPSATSSAASSTPGARPSSPLR